MRELNSSQISMPLLWFKSSMKTNRANFFQIIHNMTEQITYQDSRSDFVPAKLNWKDLRRLNDHSKIVLDEKKKALWYSNPTTKLTNNLA